METLEFNTLLDYLISLPAETEWVEFKHNKAIPDDIGEYISALANSAGLHKKNAGYLIWGVESETHNVVGTDFEPRKRKVGNEDLENWLARGLTPRVNFQILEFALMGKRAVMLKVQPCQHTPVSFKGTEFLRVGSYKKKLKDYPEKERALWLQLSRVPFEKGVASENITSDKVLTLIDFPAYFELTGQRLPDNKVNILDRLLAEKIILRKYGDCFDITNLGGILFARRLNDFETLSRKTVRVIIYKGYNRIETIKEQDGTKGYAVGFEGLVSYINDQLPRNEQLGKALRREVRMYPEVAVRELVANALIHQNFYTSGDSPTVEIFSDRIEITNPGQPLINTLRFIDEPPQSRNEALAAFMRRVNICEERGSGIDKVIFEVELYQLPAPEFRVTENHTTVVLFAHKKFSEMDKNDRIRACYQHACLEYVSNRRMTNGSLRKRFGIEDKNYPIASRIISDTIGDGLVKPFDPKSTSKKQAKYVPFWA